MCVCVCDIRRMAVCAWLDHKLRFFNMRPVRLVGSFGSSVRNMSPNSKIPCRVRDCECKQSVLARSLSHGLHEVKSGQSEKHDIFLVVVVKLLAQQLTQRCHL